MRTPYSFRIKLGSNVNLNAAFSFRSEKYYLGNSPRFAVLARNNQQFNGSRLNGLIYGALWRSFEKCGITPRSPLRCIMWLYSSVRISGIRRGQWMSAFSLVLH